MIVYCKTNKPGYEQAITPYYGYKVIDEFENYYRIIPKHKFEIWIDKKYFFTNQELREHKLNKLNDSILQNK